MSKSTDKARQAAREAAAAALRELDFPDLQAKALAGAMHLGEHVIDIVADVYRERACNPKPWRDFHRAMWRTLPRWRFLARAHHRRMARRYAAMLAAGTHIGCSP
jgi:hypothetical protein